MKIDSEEKQRKKISIFVSILTHCLLLLFFLFKIAWAPPDPPLPKFGLEINFGTSDAGSGVIQNKNKANDNKNLEDAKPIIEKLEAPPKVTPTPVTETPKVDNTVKATVDTKIDNGVIGVKETKEVVKKDVKPIEDKKDTKPVTTDSKTNSTSTTTKTDSGTGTSDKNSANNNGDKKDAVGDQGKTNGDLNSDALYGGGGSGGSSLDMAGWKWDIAPNVDDKSTENGVIVFEIKIDSDGEIVSVKQTYRTISKNLSYVYQKAVEELSFTPTSSGGGSQNIITGKLTFIIKSK